MCSEVFVKIQITKWLWPLPLKRSFMVYDNKKHAWDSRRWVACKTVLFWVFFFPFNIFLAIELFLVCCYWNQYVVPFFRSLCDNGGDNAFYSYSSIWKSEVPVKVQIFAWLIAHGKVSTCDKIEMQRPKPCLSPCWCVICGGKNGLFTIL